jgi:hypothetical protein
MVTKNNQSNDEIESAKRTRKYFLLSAAVFIVIISCFHAYRHFFYQSVNKQLAEIEASRAIPDSENAAVYYNNFFADQNNISILDELGSYAQSSHCLPWPSDSDPIGAATLKKDQQAIEKLIDISKIKEARFPIDYDSFNNEISFGMRKITFILSWAGANDLGDGRINEAISKFTAQVRIACHLNQQPVTMYKQIGVAIESVGLRNIRDLTMYENITKEQLILLDKAVSETQEYVNQDNELEEKVTRLLTSKKKSSQPLLTRTKEWWSNLFSQNIYISISDFLPKIISTQRACRILIAIRLFQIDNSRWPDSLSEIESSLPKENFIDATNNDSFVYKLFDNSFILYSKGPDNIDNDHQAGSDDVIFWSPPLQIIEKQISSDPNKESKE